jgi:hypothetical protein
MICLGKDTKDDELCSRQYMAREQQGSPGRDGKMQYGRTPSNYLERKHGKQTPRIDNFGGNA